MKLSSRFAIAGSVAALAIAPTAALAHPGDHGQSGGKHGKSESSGSSNSSMSIHATAEKTCRSDRSSMGEASFHQTYGTNKNGSDAFGKCVSETEHQDKRDQASAHSSAEKTCRSEQSSDPTGFDKTYGTNKNGRDAFGKCVSEQEKTMASSTESKQGKAEDNAAKACRAEESSDPSAFDKKYGTNKTGSNAFGKCVSEHAKAQEQQGTSSGS